VSQRQTVRGRQVDVSWLCDGEGESAVISIPPEGKLVTGWAVCLWADYVQKQPDRKGATLTELTLSLDISIVQVSRCLGNCQPQADTLLLHYLTIKHWEPLEEMPLVLWRDTYLGICLESGSFGKGEWFLAEKGLRPISGGDHPHYLQLFHKRQN
jgi:hypothetical protein